MDERICPSSVQCRPAVAPAGPAGRKSLRTVTVTRAGLGARQPECSDYIRLGLGGTVS